MWAFSFSFFLEELLLHPSREEFSSLLVKNNRAEILVCQVSEIKRRRVRKIKATLGGWLTSRHTGIKHCDSIECDTKCMFKEKKECMCRFTYAQVNEVLLFEHVAAYALFELNECVYVSGRADCTLPCAYVGTSLSCVSKCVLSPGAVSSCVKDRLIIFFYPISPLCSLAKSHKSHRPSWRGFLRLGSNSPSLGNELWIL